MLGGGYFLGFDWLTYQAYFMAYILLSTAILIVKENKKISPQNISHIFYRQISTDICVTLTCIISFTLFAMNSGLSNIEHAIILMIYLPISFSVSYIIDKNT